MKGPESVPDEAADREAVAEGPAVTSCVVGIQDPRERPSGRPAACSSAGKGQNLVGSFEN